MVKKVNDFCHTCGREITELVQVPVESKIMYKELAKRRLITALSKYSGVRREVIFTRFGKDDDTYIHRSTYYALRWPFWEYNYEISEDNKFSKNLIDLIEGLLLRNNEMLGSEYKYAKR